MIYLKKNYYIFVAGNATKNIEDIKMNAESVIGKVVIIALVGIGLYAFLALVDLIREKVSK